jgi:hypothetical protein
VITQKTHLSSTGRDFFGGHLLLVLLAHVLTNLVLPAYVHYGRTAHWNIISELTKLVIVMGSE